MSSLAIDQRARNRDMILNPRNWPHSVLPLKRGNPFDEGNTAVFAPHLGLLEYPADVEIEILIGTMFSELSKLPRKVYANVDALLDDGWIVD
jgi:hypothetical protein